MNQERNRDTITPVKPEARIRLLSKAKSILERTSAFFFNHIDNEELHRIRHVISFGGAIGFWYTDDLRSPIKIHAYSPSQRDEIIALQSHDIQRDIQRMGNVWLASNDEKGLRVYGIADNLDGGR